VVKVSSGKDNSVHAACRVKWDDGRYIHNNNRVRDKRNQIADNHVCVCARADFSPSFGVYYSGCSVSRDASTRAVHPHYDSSVIHGPAT
jgi:hypothetical protein